MNKEKEILEKRNALIKTAKEFGEKLDAKNHQEQQSQNSSL